jgi:DNA-binding winged helix-turn-helix (wHTH) protein/tetratricopeptide (TPR) repeat protein
MNGNSKDVYLFESFRLDVPQNQLSNNGTPVPLTPKAFDVLVCLVRNRGSLVTKDQLMKAVWPDAVVEESNLAKTVYTLRKALGRDHDGRHLIETIPTKGYRFIAEVAEAASNGAEGVLSDDRNGVSGERKPADSIVSAGRHVDVGRVWLPIVAVASVFLATAFGVWIYGGLRTGAVVGKAGHNGSSNGEAYRSYQQGRVVLQNRLRGHLREALPFFERAIELDAEFADAYAAKADVMVWMFWESNHPDDIGQARSAVKKALEIDPENSYAFTVGCRIAGTVDWDFRTAEGDCQRAVDLDPENADAHFERAMLMNQLGQESEALREIDAAIQLAPTSFHQRNKGVILFYSRRYKEAAELLEHVRSTDPSLGSALHWLTWSYEMDHNYEKASETYLDFRRNQGATPEVIASLRVAYEKEGWSPLQRDYVDRTRATPHNAPFFAATYCQLGEIDKAFEYLEIGIQKRSLFMVHIARDPRFDPCRNDPRFTKILQRIGLAN